MRALRAVTLFGLLFIFWLALSARLDPLFVVMGLVSAAVVTWLSLALLEGVLGQADATPRLHLWHLLTYLVWLIARIPPAGFQVARVVLDPRLGARPGVVRFRTRLASPTARTTLANSITLVPGTMTIEVRDEVFVVHAFNPQAAADLATGAMQNRIARAFRNEHDPEPVLIWEPVHDALPQDPT